MTILNILGLLGIGSVVGIVAQYFINKRIFKYQKILETKLIIFRRVYRQLYYVRLLYSEEISLLEEKSATTAIDASEVCAKSGLDIKKDLGDILFYVDGELEEMIEKLLYSLYFENALLGKQDFDNMKMIMDRLRAEISK